MSTKSGEAVNPVSNCKTGASPLPQFSDVRVLVVDDEASARNVLALVLAQIGHRCEKAMANLRDRKSTRLNSSHVAISYAVFCLKKKNKTKIRSLQYKAS